MTDIPPKHTPDDVPGSSGNLVSFYQAASNANSESFPVLKAFQDYIEAERAQARKRVVMLSIFFASIICAVVGGFLLVGVFLLRDMRDMSKDMTSLQGKLVDAALAARAPAEAAAPVYIQPAPAVSVAPQTDLVEKTVEEISKVTAALQSDIGKRIDGVNEISLQVREKVTSQESEMEKLRQELGQMKDQNERLKGDVEAIRAAPPVVVAPPPPAPVVTPPPAPTPVVAPPPPPQVAAAEDSRFPTPTKEPPITPNGVKPPVAPKGMMVTSVPLATKKTGSVPWRVIIPE